MRGKEIPNQRQSRARRVVKGMAAEEPAPQRNMLRMKKMPKAIPGTKKEVIRTFVFQRSPPTTVCECVCVCVRERVCVCV